MMCLVGVMTAMSIDYNEYKYGVRMVATSNSASSFGGKVGSGLGTSTHSAGSLRQSAMMLH